MCVDVDFDRVENNKSIFLCLAGFYIFFFSRSYFFPLPHPPFRCCFFSFARAASIIRSLQAWVYLWRAKASRTRLLFSCLRAFRRDLSSRVWDARAARLPPMLPLTMNWDWMHNIGTLTSEIGTDDAHYTLIESRNSYLNGTINLVFVVSRPFRFAFSACNSSTVGEWGERAGNWKINTSGRKISHDFLLLLVQQRQPGECRSKNEAMSLHRRRQFHATHARAWIKCITLAKKMWWCFSRSRLSTDEVIKCENSLCEMWIISDGGGKRDVFFTRRLIELLMSVNLF